MHWVWHCHMLSPCLYRFDLTTRSSVGRPLAHKPLDAATLRKMRINARKRWEEKFPEEPFKLEDITWNVEDKPSSDFEYDLVAAVERQKVFYYQVSNN